MNLMAAGEQRERQRRESRGHLLHCAYDNGMRVHFAAPLIDRSETPGNRAHLQNEKAVKCLAAELPRAHSSRHQQAHPHASDQHSEDGGRMEPFSARHQRFNSDQPERRKRCDQSR